MLADCSFNKEEATQPYRLVMRWRSNISNNKAGGAYALFIPQPPWNKAILSPQSFKLKEIASGEAKAL